MPCKIFVDSRGMLDTIKIVHEPREYHLRKTVAKMNDGFEAGEMDGINWIDGKNSLADFLTTFNVELSCKLNLMKTSRLWDEDSYNNNRKA